MLMTPLPTPLISAWSLRIWWWFSESSLNQRWNSRQVPSEQPMECCIVHYHCMKSLSYTLALFKHCKTEVLITQAFSLSSADIYEMALEMDVYRRKPCLSSLKIAHVLTSLQIGILNNWYLGSRQSQSTNSYACKGSCRLSSWTVSVTGQGLFRMLT